MLVDVSTLFGKTGQELPIFLEGTIDTVWNRLENVVFLGLITVEGTLKNNEEFFIFSAKGHCTVELPCDRCLEPVKEELTFVLEECFCRAVIDEKNSYETVQDEVKEMETFSGDQIDFSDVIKKSILGALPMKCLCSQSCNGLCPMCGSNLNLGQCDCDTLELDPRFESLRTLFSNDEEV